MEKKILDCLETIIDPLTERIIEEMVTVTPAVVSTKKQKAYWGIGDIILKELLNKCIVDNSLSLDRVFFFLFYKAVEIKCFGGEDKEIFLNLVLKSIYNLMTNNLQKKPEIIKSCYLILNQKNEAKKILRKFIELNKR